MISGITNDRSMRKFDARAPRPRHRSRPIAKSTPRGTATSIVKADSVTVWRIALRSSGSRNSEPEPSNPVPVQYWSENGPVKVLFERPLENEIQIAMRTGTSDHSRYAHVIASRTRGLRQGSARQLRRRFGTGTGNGLAGGRPTVRVWVGELIVAPGRARSNAGNRASG